MITLADHMGSEEAPTQWWEYAIFGGVTLLLLVMLGIVLVMLSGGPR